ncbi:MAG: hypothetical protein JO038_09680 [Alphaproteobacteria bacterium]|nr:hypothetical protein [Alphaproteobacteria bacterium]
MPETPAPETSAGSSRKAAERAARDERLAQALRDNLRRRKEQARARQHGESPPAQPVRPPRA